MVVAIASARMFFNFHLNGDRAALAELLGDDMANEFLAIEDARNALRHFFPNRIAVLRLRNIGPRPIRDVTIEYEVAGAIYDTKVRTVAEGTSEPHLPFEHRLVIPRILVGQAYDFTIWYRYQSVSERVFPDKINLIQELTQGFTISNIAVGAGGRVVFKADLLKDVPAYDRLYDGDARKRDNPQRELAALINARGAEAAKAAASYNDQNLTARDLTLDALGSFPVQETQIDNIWITFQSPAQKRYCAVCVYEHPKGPYILLSSEDRDESDFVTVRTALSNAIAGEAEEDITDRSNDICSTIAVKHGFERPAVVGAFRMLEATGYRDIAVAKLHYQKSVA
jgi:hypothetical protein